MLGTSNARMRQSLVIVCLCLNFILSICIIGLVGVHGRVTFENFNTGCLLYMTREGDVFSYNDSYCLFPIIGSAVIAFMIILFLFYLSLVISRNDEFSWRPVSFFFLVFYFLLALLAFAICAEIGIGLNRGCKVLGDQSYRCHKTRDFNALWGAEICAGLIGGLFVIAVVLEMFQLLAQAKSRYSSTVVPSRATSAAVAPYQTPTAAPKTEYTEPAMTQQTTGYANQSSTYYQQPTPQPQQQNAYYAPQTTATYESQTFNNSHPTDPNGAASYGYQT